MDRIYYKNLYGLRFIAAFMVFVGHVERMKFTSNMPNFNSIPFVFRMGGAGVNLFFVLSGFLITSLLLHEKQSTGTIDIRHFYIRRILRIWPLYFLTLALAFFVIPNFSALNGFKISLADPIWWLTLLLFPMMLPNLAYTILPGVPFGSHLWTVGVEEQFYLIWPWILRKRLEANLAYLFIAILIVNVALFELRFDYPNNKAVSGLSHFFEHFRIQCMAIGALAAIINFRHKELAHVFYPLRVQLLIFAAIIYLLASTRYFICNNELQAVCFAVVIINCVGNASNIFRLEAPVLNYFGRISYGIYIFHILAIKFALLAMGNRVFDGSLIANLILYALCFSLTIIISSFSYHFFEKYFLSLKKKNALIRSG